MWTQLQNVSHVQPRLVSDLEMNALLDEACDDVSNAYTQSLSMRPVWRGNPRRNQILGALSEAHYAVIKDGLDVVELTAGQVLYESGDVLQHVYFPTTCTASLLSSTAEGETAELALTGRNGLIGVPLVLGGTSMAYSVQIQCAGQAYRMSADRFVRVLRGCDQLQQLALSYVQSLMAQMAQSIVCSRHHSVGERLSQWLLWNSDGLGSPELTVTHETIAHMLGVRRESVTQSAGKLQSAGWIRNSRGKIVIHDRAGLLRSVCECYGRIRSDAEQYVQRMGQLADSPMDHGASYGLTPAEEHIDSVQTELQKYVDAYDFAPVGFVTLNAQGRMVKTNLAGAILLDTQRSQCQSKLFVDFLDAKSRRTFMDFHLEVLSGQCRRHCVVTLPATAHRSGMTLRIDATSDESGEESRMVMIDVGAQEPEALALHEVTAMPTWHFQAAPSLQAGAFKV